MLDQNKLHKTQNFSQNLLDLFYLNWEDSKKLGETNIIYLVLNLRIISKRDQNSNYFVRQIFSLVVISAKCLIRKRTVKNLKY